MNEAVVRIKGLTKAYGGRPPALQDVELDIPPGVTGLLGPNGAGKSTLIQCVLGLLPGWRGQVEVLGVDARRRPREVRRRVGFMPELDAYVYGISGLEAVRHLARLSGLPGREALRRGHEILWHVGLGEAAYRKLETYSTGMRQRFKLAQALVHDPDLVFLDEPLAGLDPDGRREVRGLVGDLARRHGKHVVWSSHLLPDVQKVADQVAILHLGRSRGIFRLEDLAAREGRFTLEVEGDGEHLAASLRTLDGVPIEVRAERSSADDGTASGGTQRTTFELVGPPTLEAAHLLSFAHHLGVRVRRVAPRGETLEDAFLRLLGDAPAPPPPQPDAA